MAKDLIVRPRGKRTFPKLPKPPTEVWRPFWVVTGNGQVEERRCMFDGLPPGVYSLSCPCPRCTPSCLMTSPVV